MPPSAAALCPSTLDYPINRCVLSRSTLTVFTFQAGTILRKIQTACHSLSWIVSVDFKTVYILNCCQWCSVENSAQLVPMEAETIPWLDIKSWPTSQPQLLEYNDSGVTCLVLAYGEIQLVFWCLQGTEDGATNRDWYESSSDLPSYQVTQATMTATATLPFPASPDRLLALGGSALPWSDRLLALDQSHLHDRRRRFSQ